MASATMTTAMAATASAKGYGCAGAGARESSRAGKSTCAAKAESSIAAQDDKATTTTARCAGSVSNASRPSAEAQLAV